MFHIMHLVSRLITLITVEGIYLIVERSTYNIFSHFVTVKLTIFGFSIIHLLSYDEHGLDIVQALGRRLPTAATGVRTQVRSCRISGGQSGTEVGFLRLLRFPLPILI
jgi:hypothetical protein